MKHHERLEHSPFGAMITALDAERSALGVVTSALGAVTSAHGVAISALAGVSGDIGDCRVGITPQMCNRVTNHGDMDTFSKPAWNHFCNVIVDLCGIIAYPCVNANHCATH